MFYGVYKFVGEGVVWVYFVDYGIVSVGFCSFVVYGLGCEFGLIV